MEFLDDPSEVDYHIQNLKGYIDSGDWDEVKAEVTAFIRMIKKELSSLPQGDFHILSGCKKIGDILDVKRCLNTYGADEFRMALLSLFRMQESLSWDQPFDDKDQVKQDFYTEVDQIQRYLEKIILIFAMPEKWGLEKKVGKLEKKVENNEKGLEKGRKQPKGLISLEAFILDCFDENSLDITTVTLQKKIRARNEYNAFFYRSNKSYRLYYNDQDDRIYEEEFFSDDETVCNIKDIHIRQVDKYRKRLLKMIF